MLPYSQVTMCIYFWIDLRIALLVEELLWQGPRLMAVQRASFLLNKTESELTASAEKFTEHSSLEECFPSNCINFATVPDDCLPFGR